jgi:hypothetical protein
MRSRCNKRSNNRWKYYGGKGIKVCSRWEKFQNFLDDMGEKPKGMTLERIRGRGNYTPSNCKWATPKEQALNRPSTRMFSIDGKTQCLSDWARQLNVQISAVRWRLNNGWSIKKALIGTPRKDSRRAVHA